MSVTTYLDPLSLILKMSFNQNIKEWIREGSLSVNVTEKSDHTENCATVLVLDTLITFTTVSDSHQ